MESRNQEKFDPDDIIESNIIEKIKTDPAPTQNDSNLGELISLVNEIPRAVKKKGRRGLIIGLIGGLALLVLILTVILKYLT